MTAEVTTLMTVGELSRQTRVPIKALRAYTDWGLINTLGRSGANYRLYDDEALRCVQIITEMRGLGLTLAEIRSLAHAHPTATASSSAPASPSGCAPPASASTPRSRSWNRPAAASTRSKPPTAPNSPASPAPNSGAATRCTAPAAPDPARVDRTVAIIGSATGAPGVIPTGAASCSTFDWARRGRRPSAGPGVSDTTSRASTPLPGDQPAWSVDADAAAVKVKDQISCERSDS